MFKKLERTWSFGIIFTAFLFLFLGAEAVAMPPSLAPLNPEFIQYQQNLQQGIITQQVTEEGYGLGFIPPSVDLSHLKGQKVFKAQSLLGFTPSYDLRATGKLTSVKDQGQYGTCWAHATYGSLESCLLPGETRDFSENNLANLHGFDYSSGGFHDVNKGGNAFMSIAYLSRWDGPVNESDDPYSNPDASPPGLTVQKHVQEMIFLPGRSSFLDNDTIKQTIIDYGAIHTSIYWNIDFYNNTNAAYYYNGTGSNHAVCVVGWDDNFDKAKFNTTPPGNGAFIIKNSWGISFGDSGYFYISYYDTQVGTNNAVFNNAEPTTNYQQIYQYDPLGWVQELGDSSNTGWFSNIFTATLNPQLKAVGFYTAVLNSNYEISIHTGVDAGQPGSGSIVGTKTGTIAIPGYHTIVLDSLVSLTSNQQFSVVVKLTTPGYNYPIAIEAPLAGYSEGVTANAGESFISSNGSTWSDITDYYVNTNVCLKAFTFIAPHTITASAGEGGTITPSGAVRVEDGREQAFTITPNAGYRITDVKVDNVSVGIVTSYTFPSVIVDHTIAVTFVPIPTYIITATAGEGGTITPSGAVIVYEKDTPTFTVKPDVGYHIIDVKVGGLSVGARISYTFDAVTANSTISASFAVNRISGKVTQGSGLGAPGLVGVIFNLAGTGFSDSKTTDGNGDYQFSIVPADVSYTLTPQKTGWNFQPVQISIPALDGDLSNQNFSAYLEITFTTMPSGNPKEVTKGTNAVQCTVAAQASAVPGTPITYIWTASDGYFTDSGTTTSHASQDPNRTWIADVAMSPFEEYKLVPIQVTASCTNGLSKTASYFQRVNPVTVSGTTSSGSGGGGGPVGPLAAGVSALLVWWKRRKQR